MSEDTKELKKSIDSLSKQIDRLETSVRGDQFGNKGLAKRVREVEKNLDALYTFRDKILGIILGVSGTTGIVTGAVVWMLTSAT